MSRCFPFPPPGYEKARNDNNDLLKKEKHKEKKQKKDKKEKEKRDSKEKQDKDRSKEKNKDRKEKRKDKDRERDKDKNKTPDEKKLEVQPRNGEKLNSNSLQKTDNKDKSSLHLQELAKRLRDGERASGSQMVQKVGDVAPIVVERPVINQLKEKDEVQNKIEDHRRVNGKIDSRGLEKPIIKLEEKKNVEKQMEAKENSKHKELNGKGDKLGDKEREKNKKTKEKEDKKKAKEIIEPRPDQLKLNEKVSRVHQGNKDLLDFRNMKSPPESVNLSFASPSSTEGSLGKRKEIERNGYLLDNGSRPSKIPRNLSFKESVVENGKKLDPFQASVEPQLDNNNNNHKVDFEEKKINGSITSHQPLKFPKAAEENGKNLSKPPHPDMKYLNKVLSVPKMEEWCGLDDEQEWLLSSGKLQPKKSSGSLIEPTQQAWAEAFRIESADISALPYVIPY